MLASMQGKTALITGATAGIGREAARQLAAAGAKVVIVSRNPQKCVTVAEQIKAQTSNVAVSSIAADLSTRNGVQQAAYEFKKRHTHLDILVNNVGAYFLSRQLSADGIEMNFALNHLGYFHLTTLLLDLLKSSGAARIINVASGAHRGQKLDFDDLQMEKNYNHFTAYGRSKLCNLLFTYELARRLGETPLTVNAVDPGLVATEFAKNNGLLARLGMNLLKPIARSPKSGAESIFYLAVSHEVRGQTGKYFKDKIAVPSDPASYDIEAAARLWDVSLEMAL